MDRINQSGFDALNSSDVIYYNANETDNGAWYHMAGPPPGIADMNAWMEALNSFKRIYYPLMATLGSLGNILAFFVFVITRLRKISSAYYLAAIAFSDTGWLWTNFVANLRLYEIEYYHQQGACQTTTFFNMVFTFLSVWYLVALVTEKFIGLYWPLVRTRVCTTFRAKLVIIFMAVFSVVVYNYVTYVFGPDRLYDSAPTTCMRWGFQAEHFDNLNKLDSVVVALVPQLSIIIMFILIALRARHYYKVSRTIERPNIRRHPQDAKPLKVTRILLPMTFIVLLIHLPSSCVRVIGISASKEFMSSGIFFRTQGISQIIMCASYGVKCLAYLTFSRSFRREAAGMFTGLISKIIVKAPEEKQNAGVGMHAVPMLPFNKDVKSSP